MIVSPVAIFATVTRQFYDILSVVRFIFVVHSNAFRSWKSNSLCWELEKSPVHSFIWRGFFLAKPVPNTFKFYHGRPNVLGINMICKWLVTITYNHIKSQQFHIINIKFMLLSIIYISVHYTEKCYRWFIDCTSWRLSRSYRLLYKLYHAYIYLQIYDISDKLKHGQKCYNNSTMTILQSTNSHNWGFNLMTRGYFSRCRPVLKLWTCCRWRGWSGPWWSGTLL